MWRLSSATPSSCHRYNATQRNAFLAHCIVTSFLIWNDGRSTDYNFESEKNATEIIFGEEKEIGREGNIKLAQHFQSVTSVKLKLIEKCKVQEYIQS
ncbi:unnamed protein product [Brugia pahangi]|uniref:Uncharacterized protein n=1 Tax=Brugia pahangi TaxID=6280 RepID=A0A0N4T0I5_BRUPA|nr:unnamed protein product [Brugia pahangi]